MRRLLVVYSPHASKYRLVEKEVFAEARKLRGWTVGRFEVKPVDVGTNAKELAKIIRTGDVIVSAGGDGTAAVGLNAIMISKKKAIFAALPYGNFNDNAEMLGVKNLQEAIELVEKERAVEVWPIEAVVDGRHWRYALGYMTVGMFAEATHIFDEKKTRSKFEKGRNKIYGWWLLAGWYLRNRRKEFLPKAKLNGKKMDSGTTDYMVVNGGRVGGILKSEKWYLQKKEFLEWHGEMKSILGLASFMMRGMSKGLKGQKVTKSVLEFCEPTDIEIHAEGECEKMIDVSKIEIKKAEKRVMVIMGD